MGRIRTIKPEFFTSPDVAALDHFTRLVFIGVWTHCDDHGRCLYDPRLIRAALFALDDGVSPEDLRKSLETLHEGGQVVIYDHGNRAYLEVAKWADHQRVSHPGKDRLPASSHPDSILRKVSGESRETLVPEQGTGNREQGNIAAPAAEDRNAIWDALIDEVGEAKTATERSNRGKTVTELLEAGATPDDIRRRCNEYRTRYQNAALTDAALRKHWSGLEPTYKSTNRVRNGINIAPGVDL